MILTVTLNASIDKAYQLACPLGVGTVMRVAACDDSAGGKGLNAARAVAACGEEVLATGIVGGNNGRRLLELLEADGIPSDFALAQAETRCCVNVLEPDGRSTEFLEPGREIGAAELSEAEKKVVALAEGADAVTMSGSLPKGAPTDTYASLVRKIQATGTPVILDTSGEALTSGIAAQPAVAKPNSDEIGQVLGHAPQGEGEVASAARELHERGVDKVVVSLGGGGAIMVSDAGTYRGVAPRIEAVNPVGAGDTMVGALAVAIARGMRDAEQLRFAMACASASCLSPSTGRFDAGVARELFERATMKSDKQCS